MSFRRLFSLSIGRALWVAMMIACVTVTSAYAEENGFETLPVDFTARTLSHDEEKQTVTATGDVEMLQNDRILRADRIVYFLEEDRVIASGNVYVLDEDGNVSFSDYVELKGGLKEGSVKGLLALLADGSRFTADTAVRSDEGKRMAMTNASYTVCKVCEENPNPMWQIKAAEVTHDTETKTVSYKDARMEVLGVPVLWTPVLSHPDPTVKRKSGFLRPEYGWTTALGTHVKGGYYFDIAPDKDMTLAVEPTTLAGVLVEGEWRQRFSRGELQINASTVNSDRTEEDGRVEADRQRGHIFANGRMDIDDNWRGGFNLAHTTDKQYLRLYDISQDNVLETQAYLERFSGRNYSNIKAMTFQDVRLGVRPDQPDIIPMAEHYMIGTPGGVLGGRWDANMSALVLNRQNSNQSVQRGNMYLGWERYDISSVGFVTETRMSGQGTFYAVQDSDVSKINPALDSDTDTFRGVATASLTTSYPLVKRMEKSQAVIEPVIGLSYSPETAKNNDSDIPNEDSSDITFDTNNLFSSDRFPGIDRVEDGGRVNYGIKGGVYGDNGRYGQLFFGQSYRFVGGRIFPPGSGLEDRQSDFVGQIKLGLSRYLDADYRFQIDHKDMKMRRHEVGVGGGNDVLRLDTRYMYLAGVPGGNFPFSRQQMQIDGTYALSKKWTLGVYGLMDFGDDPGLRNATGILSYSDECLTLALEAGRNVADAASGDDETKILLRIGLKNIGEFAGPRIGVGSPQDK